jgi:multiple sugar transport system substrate-binding protein
MRRNVSDGDQRNDAIEIQAPDFAFSRDDFLLGAGKTLVAIAGARPFVSAARASARRRIPAQTDPIAAAAVNAGKRWRGIRLRKATEEGLRTLDDKNFTGPLWKRLTGIDIEVVEAAPPQLHAKVVAAHRAKASVYDVIEAWPAWIPDLAERGVIAPIDDFVEKYDANSTLADYHPLYRSLMNYKGKTWGFYDDGDIWTLYYRTDIFGDRRLRQAYKARFKRELRVPNTWDAFLEVAQFITDQLAPNVYGTAMGRALGDPGNQLYFFQQFQANGGKFFDTRSMNALINGSIGVKTMNQILAQNRASIPGVERLDFITSWVHWLNGKTAMMVNWPATARISENVAQRAQAFAFLPASKIAGNVGYATGPLPAFAPGVGSYLKCIAADSKHEEAAYLFTQWATSPSVSLRRVLLPYTLTDPYRISHFRSQQLRNRWPSGVEYLRALCEGANHGVLDLTITGAADYALALDRAMSAIYAGQSVQDGLDDAARAWNAITRRLGVDHQRHSYLEFLKLLGSTPRNTASARHVAVHC